jgi:hypothetical protein
MKIEQSFFSFKKRKQEGSSFASQVERVKSWTKEHRKELLISALVISILAMSFASGLILGGCIGIVTESALNAWVLSLFAQGSFASITMVGVLNLLAVGTVFGGLATSGYCCGALVSISNNRVKHDI